MKRRSLLLGVASLGCSRTPRPSSTLARALIELSKKHDRHGHDDAWTHSELERIARRVEAKGSVPGSPATTLSGVLFDDLAYVREVERTSLDFVLLPQVLRSRRGSCVGLGSLYLCVAELLGFSAHGVLRPGHFFVSHEAPGPACNVELLRRGELMPDAWYSARFPLKQSQSKSYGRPLRSEEVVGVAAFNIGNERRREGRLEAAESAYRDAIAAFPSFAEAHAGLGSIQQLLGQDRSAASSYARALELDATLPGVDKNLALLKLSSPRESEPRGSRSRR